LDYELNLIGLTIDEHIVVTEVTEVKTLINKLSKIVFKNIDRTNFNFYLIGDRLKAPVKLDPNMKFISYGFRKEDRLKFVSEPIQPNNSDQLTEIQIIIKYSPFDSIDKQKLMLDKSGYLRKQGGSQGGSKSWKKRWLEIDNNCLVYYTERKARIPKGFVNLTNFVSVQEATDQRKIDNQFYFSVTTTERSGPLLFSTPFERDMQDWISTIRQYCNLLRIEQANNVKIMTLEDKLLMEGLQIKNKKKKSETNAASGSISEPFLARILFSVSSDWEWNSDQDPSEVFEFLEILGVGACGKVFKAVHRSMNFELAIKVIKQEKDLQEELEREINILKKCRSENVIAYFGLVPREHDTWILMEYCAVGSIKDVMKVLGETVNEIQCCYIINRTLIGLDYLHSRNILHLDIKAANILLSVQGIVKLADFGVSQLLKSSDMTKDQDDFVGSPYYMAPEIIKKQGYNNKADIWSLGITIIEMMEYYPPNTDITTIEMLPLITERPPPTLKPTTPASNGIRSFLSKLLVKDPLLRPNATDMLNDPVVDNIIGSNCLISMIQRCITQQVSKRRRFTIEMLEQ